MALDSKREASDKYVEMVARPFAGINPNVLSVLSVVFAAAFAIAYLLSGSFLYLAPLFVILSAFFDAIDGKVSRMRNLASKRGDLVDHFLDRVSDVFLSAGIGFSAFSHPAYAFLGLEGILLTSYMGTQSQALGVGRDYSGIVGRADRLVLIFVFSIMQIVVPFSYTLYSVMLTPSTVILLWFFFAGNYNAAQRFIRAYRKL
ncbi:MAG: CDP-alcohol phosphatidyltransferase family protein [Candidatus Thermoplasmatota archaeon]|nr:CDP-alcohol phosphatidyltransferase family protein [Candidatus Thermoplasmatota archaeon]